MRLISRMLGAALVLTLSMFAEDFKLAPDARKPGRSVIVQFSDDPDSALTSRLANAGLKLRQYMGNLKAGVFDVTAPAPAAALLAASREAAVQYITPDRPVAGSSLDYAVSSIYADFGNSGYATGKNITVAVIDSGVNVTGDFAGGKGRVLLRLDLTGGNNPNDEYGHGTHVASMIAGNGNMSDGRNYFRTFAGVAPEANIVSLKVLDKNGMGTESAVVRAIDTAIALRNLLNIKVINLSLGRPVLESYKKDPMCQAVERAYKAGIVVVIAAGNEGRNNLAKTRGYGMIMSPANDPYVITVGATKDVSPNNISRTDDRLASYSSKGPSAIDWVVKPDVVAPGNSIIANAVTTSALYALPGTQIPLSTYSRIGSGNSKDYFSLSGTSMSAALVSGAAALMLDRDSDLTPDTIKARLMKTAWKMGNVPTSTSVVGNTIYRQEYNMFTVGAGFIAVQAARRSKDEVKRGYTAASPTVKPVKRVSSTGAVTYKLTLDLKGTNIIWGGEDQAWAPNIIWGGEEVAGTNIIWGGEELLATNIIWGGEEALNIIWGGEDGQPDVGPGNIIWGGDDQTSWGGNSVRTYNIIWGGLVDDDVNTSGDPQ